MDKKTPVPGYRLLSSPSNKQFIIYSLLWSPCITWRVALFLTQTYDPISEQKVWYGKSVAIKSNSLGRIISVSKRFTSSRISTQPSTSLVCLQNRPSKGRVQKHKFWKILPRGGGSSRCDFPKKTVGLIDWILPNNHRLSRRLRFDMLAYLRLRNWPLHQPHCKHQT